jgi:hypothetical protein
LATSLCLACERNHTNSIQYQASRIDEVLKAVKKEELRVGRTSWQARAEEQPKQRAIGEPQRCERKIEKCSLLAGSVGGKTVASNDNITDEIEPALNRTDDSKTRLPNPHENIRDEEKHDERSNDRTCATEGASAESSDYVARSFLVE